MPVRISKQNGYPVKLEFRFYKGAQGWKIFDVVANRTSAVVYYRRYFNQQNPGFAGAR